MSTPNKDGLAEMALAFSTVPPMNAPTEVDDAEYDEYGPDETMTVGSPANEYDPEDITIYSNSITPVTYSNSEAVAVFDVVFSVGINVEGVSKTYQVVKRIGIDKCKIAQEASCSTPVSIVESKSAALKEEAARTAKRFRQIAGLE